MHTAVRDEAEEVKSPAARFGCVEGDARDHRVAPERLVVDGVVDARDVHHRDAAGAKVQVADFAVSHLSRRKADVGTAGADDVVRVRREEGVEPRCLGEADGVVGGLFPFTETVENDEDEGRGRAVMAAGR